MQLPKNVRWFEWLAYGSLAVTAALLPFNEKAHSVIHRMGTGVIIFWFFFFLLWIAIIWGISRRRLGWLRWIKVVGLLFSLLGVRVVTNSFLTEPVYCANWLISMLLNSAACYLIFTGDAVAWFKSRTIEETNAPVS